MDVEQERRHRRPVSGLPQLAERLRRRSRKLTGARRAILELLRGQGGPLSAKEIFEALPGGECDLATIYRSMHLLEDMGMVKRFDLGDRIGRFELLDEGDDGHHHHLVCLRCSGVIEIEGCLVPERLEAEIAVRSGFMGVTHKLEFFGVCPTCQ